MVKTRRGTACRYWLQRRASLWSFVRKFRLPEEPRRTVHCLKGVLIVAIKKLPLMEKNTKFVQVAIG